MNRIRDLAGQRFGELAAIELWARGNTDRFGKPPGDKSAKQIADGFKAIALTLRGKRKHPSLTCFGWTLRDVPQNPADDPIKRDRS